MRVTSHPNTGLPSHRQTKDNGSLLRGARGGGWRTLKETRGGRRPESRSLTEARRPRASLRAPDPRVTPTSRVAQGREAEPGSGRQRGERRRPGQAAYRAVRAAQSHHQLRLVLVWLLRQPESLLHRKPLLRRRHGAATRAARVATVRKRPGLSFPRLPADRPASTRGVVTAGVFK